MVYSCSLSLCVYILLSQFSNHFLLKPWITIYSPCCFPLAFNGPPSPPSSISDARTTRPEQRPQSAIAAGLLFYSVCPSVSAYTNQIPKELDGFFTTRLGWAHTICLSILHMQYNWIPLYVDWPAIKGRSSIILPASLHKKRWIYFKVKTVILFYSLYHLLAELNDNANKSAFNIVYGQPSPTHHRWKSFFAFN